VDSRKTKLITSSDLLPDEQVWVMIGEKGAVARTTSPEMVKIPLKPKEQPFALLEANTQDILYLFAADGRAVSLPVYQLPQATQMGDGTHWADLTGFSRRDHLAAAQVLPAGTNGFLVMGTMAGIVKRIRMEDLPGITTDPFLVINVADDDALGWVRLTDGEQEVVLATANGQVIRFTEEQVRPMGLPAGGVMGIKLAHEADGVVAMGIVEEDAFIWSITDNGLAKATSLAEYPSQGRHGQGVRNLKLAKGAAEVVATVICKSETELLITTAIGSTKKMRIKDGIIGSRSITPRAVITVGERNRITGALRITERPDVPEEETAVAVEQLTLLGEAPVKIKQKRKK
jgi:DNA gyrase subunit A